MDWPHDPDSDLGSEGKRKYGQAILAKKVDEDGFPISTAAFVEEFGDHPVRIDHETVVSVADVFETVDVAEIEDLQTFHRVVGRAMRDAGYWTFETPDSGR